MAEAKATEDLFQHHPDDPDPVLARLVHRNTNPEPDGVHQVAETHHEGNRRAFNTSMFQNSSVNAITNSTFSVVGGDNNYIRQQIVIDSDTQQRAAFERDQRQKLKRWLNASDYKGSLAAARRLRYRDTCTWITDKPPFLQWRLSSDPSDAWLFVHGIPGAGKTVLSSWLIEQAQREPGLIFYHYFKDSGAEHTCLSAVRSLIDQLLTQFVDQKSRVLEELESALHDARVRDTLHPQFPHLWDIFRRCLSAHAVQTRTRITIIFDAMDECSALDDIVESLTKLMVSDQALANVRVLMTGRMTAWNTISSMYPSGSPLRPIELMISPEDIQHDITVF
ncbi:hypothetical protein H0H92_007975, partial [Tricholoma furcatifolium]